LPSTLASTAARVIGKIRAILDAPRFLVVYDRERVV
jgi:hypothetical protein